ncbi:MAG: hypothetical protein H6972_04105 [Gammaproteobacteria bacterium]|nr:hypothetical protein [Gammaproteobacteria bacterium]
MATKTYRAYVGNERSFQLEIRADFAQAADTIEWRCDPRDEFDVGPLQVADARHDPEVATLAINGWLSGGGGGAFDEDENWRLVEVEEGEQASANNDYC